MGQISLNGLWGSIARQSKTRDDDWRIGGFKERKGQVFGTETGKNEGELTRSSQGAHRSHGLGKDQKGIWLHNGEIRSDVAKIERLHRNPIPVQSTKVQYRIFSSRRIWRDIILYSVLRTPSNIANTSYSYTYVLHSTE